MHGWLDADAVNTEDLLYGLIGDSVHGETFPPTSYSVEGSARIYAHYRNDIGQNTLDSVMYTLNPDHNKNVTGDPSQSRLELRSKVSEARHKQKTLIQTAGAATMFGMSSAGNACTPKSTFDKLGTATDAKANRKISKDLSRLIDLTLKEQEWWQDKEKAQDEKDLDGSGV